jgi:hypothetical protein
VVEVKLVRLVSLLRLLHAAPLVVRAMDAKGPNAQNPNVRDLNAWVHLDVEMFHCQGYVAHTSVLQQDEFLAENRCCLKPGNVVVSHAGDYTSAHSHQDHHLGAVAALGGSAVLLSLRNCWLRGAAGSVPLDCYCYAFVGRSMSY